MNTQVNELKHIIDKQIELYEKIHDIEQAKTSAISDKDGTAIEGLSTEQEQLIAEANMLEDSRTRLIETYRKVNMIEDMQRDVSIKDLVKSMDEDSGHQLMAKGMELKQVLKNLQSVLDMNKNLLEDNLEFFQILLSGLRETKTNPLGYGNDGREDAQNTNPMLFNTKA